MSLVQRPQSEFNGTLGGSVDALIADFDMVVNESKNLGLTVSASKCELITDDDELIQQFRMVAPDIKHGNNISCPLLVWRTCWT
jgi:hypothetical protein